MKRFFALLLTMALSVSVAACGGGTDTNNDPAPVDSNTEQDAGEDEVGAATADADALDYWNQGWYGWWIIGDTTGAYVENENVRFDAFAIFNIDEDGTGVLEIWDDETTRNEPIGYVNVSLSPDGSVVYSEGGSFMYGDINSGDWAIDPTQASFDDMLIIEGAHEDEDGTYTYDIYLRPWGVLWDDVAAEFPEGMPEYYDDWYLPLVEGNEDMPEDGVSAE